MYKDTYITCKNRYEGQIYYTTLQSNSILYKENYCSIIQKITNQYSFSKHQFMRNKYRILRKNIICNQPHGNKAIHLLELHI